MTQAAFAAHLVERAKIKTIRNHVLVYDMAFDGRTLNSGIILLNDNGKGYGIRPRWGRVYAVGPDQHDVVPDQWIMVAHGRWTRGIKIQDEHGEKTLRRIDPDDILLVSDSPEQPIDDTQSTATHVDKQTA
jgi:hypothetical protein